MSSPSDSPAEPAADTPAARLLSARVVLAAASALLIAGWLFFDLPAAFALTSIVALVALAAFTPADRRLTREQREAQARPPVWPGTSMKTIVEVLPQPALLLDAFGVVRYTNRHATRLFPATRPGDPFTLTFRWPEFADAVRDAQAGRASSVEFSEPGESSNVYSVTLSPLSRPGGDDFILVTLTDISDRLAVARMRADFVANASHELRTPLASLTGFIETLLTSARQDTEATEKFLRIMLDQARRMRRLIDDLLSLSRAEMRVHTRPTTRADLTAALRHVGDALAPLAAEYSVTLAIDAPAEPVEVIGDRDELVQLVQNLVENAIRYGASGKRVDVRLETANGERPRARIVVRDYGPGIAPEHLPRLTERFYRADVGASREMKGTGLGLAIVKHILTRHGGHLDIASEPGEGAVFTAELPLPGEAR